MEKSMGNLQLILNAARQHYRDEQWWRLVPGPAYFESNLKKAENRAKLGEAIDRLEKQLPEIVKSFEEPSSCSWQVLLATRVCSERRENFIRFIDTGESATEYLVHLDCCSRCQETVEEAIKLQTRALENLARYLRKKSGKK